MGHIDNRGGNNNIAFIFALPPLKGVCVLTCVVTQYMCQIISTPITEDIFMVS